MICVRRGRGASIALRGLSEEDAVSVRSPEKLVDRVSVDSPEIEDDFLFFPLWCKLGN